MAKLTDKQQRFVDEYLIDLNATQEMKLSYSYTIDLHKQALEAFEKTYDNLHYLTQLFGE